MTRDELIHAAITKTKELKEEGEQFKATRNYREAIREYFCAFLIEGRLWGEHPRAVESLSQLIELLKEVGDTGTAETLERSGRIVMKSFLKEEHYSKTESLQDLLFRWYNEPDYDKRDPAIIRPLQVPGREHESEHIGVEELEIDLAWLAFNREFERTMALKESREQDSFIGPSLGEEAN